MIKSRFRPTLLKLVIVAALVILAGTGIAWWQLVRNNPDRLFWSMVDNNLKTASFTRYAIQDDGGQRVENIIEVRTAPYHLATGTTTITQRGATAASVTTENVGTPYTDYVRYTDINTSQTSADGNKLNFNGIKNVWSKTTNPTNETNGQLYNESVLGVVPTGNLSAPERRQLIELMKSGKVYTYHIASSERTGILERSTYTLNVTINAEAYIKALKTFARSLGLTNLEAIDTSQYRSTQPVDVQLKVDGWTRQLTQVSYGNGAKVENIRARGSVSKLQSPPVNTISIDELQSRLQSLQ